MITIDIIPGRDGQPVMIRASASTDGSLSPQDAVGKEIQSQSDVALYARAMLSSAAYMFAQGQPPQFGPEIPREVLR
jgi:hypothetical protein